MVDVRWPNNTHRLAIAGHTGSGKTFAGMWHLGRQNLKRNSWTIVDTKGDDLIRDIGKMEQVKHIKITDTPGPRGLHIVRPLPHQKEELNAFFGRVWAKGNRGIYIDEGYMIDKPDDYFLALLTQGRSLHVPMIILSQRPRYISKFVFTEADFLQIFNLNYDDDRREIGNMTRYRYHPDVRLSDYHSMWYDVGRDQVTTFQPVPPRREILDKFKHQLDIHKVLI
jgi:hypothetical protein